MFLLFSTLLLTNWRWQWLAGFLLMAGLASAGFFFAQLYFVVSAESFPTLNIIDVVRKGAFLSFLCVAIWRQQLEELKQSRTTIVLLSVGILLLIYLAIGPYIPGTSSFQYLKYQVFGHVIISVLGLILIEKLWSSTSPSGRWRLKFLCFGIGGIFIYELFLFSDAMLFHRLESQLMNVRGAVNAICVPLMAVSVARNPDWKMELFVSRQVVYHGTAVLAVGLYLIVMASVGYFVRNTEAEWGYALQIVFLFGAISVLFVLFFSTELRARLKIFITKHFYKNKYDYREEWLGFARTLASNMEENRIYTTIIKAVTDVIK
ncbi:MAG: hypothetical protein HKN08_01985, partial [Gammaproteobacteria bacterium]|nr:hypothetical protein [Gammaproteobacteria bacterium]